MYFFCVQVASSLCSEGKNWDDYILVSQDGDLQAAGGGGGRAATERTPPIRQGRVLVRMEPEGAARSFHDPLMAGTTSGSSSPDEGSTHSKDSDFTIVNPNDLWTNKSPLSSFYTCIISNSEGVIEGNWLGIRVGNLQFLVPLHLICCWLKNCTCGLWHFRSQIPYTLSLYLSSLPL